MVSAFPFTIPRSSYPPGKNIRGSSLVEILVVTLILILAIGMFSNIWMSNLAAMDVYQLKSELWDHGRKIMTALSDAGRQAAYIEVASDKTRVSFYDEKGEMISSVTCCDGKLSETAKGQEAFVLTDYADPAACRFEKRGAGLRCHMELKGMVNLKKEARVPLHFDVLPRN